MYTIYAIRNISYRDRQDNGRLEKRYLRNVFHIRIKRKYEVCVLLYFLGLCSLKNPCPLIQPSICNSLVALVCSVNANVDKIAMRFPPSHMWWIRNSPWKKYSAILKLSTRYERKNKTRLTYVCLLLVVIQLTIDY